MSKGDYNGGSSVVGFSGSGWTGSGSPTMQPASHANQVKQRSGKPRKLLIPDIPVELARDEDVERARKKAEALGADVRSAQNRLKALEKRLGSACDDLSLAIANAKRARRTVWPNPLP